MKKMLVANWKMNPESLSEAKKIATAVATSAKTAKKTTVVVCPPFHYLGALSSEKSFILGAQDVFWEEKGAYTGEVSPAMLKNMGVEFVIVGHSERRAHTGETDEMINKKIKAATGAGLTVILCVGEPGTVRAKGIRAAQRFIESQLEKDLKGVVLSQGSLIIAYEPLWAIGSNTPDTPEGAAEIADFIKHNLSSQHKIIGSRCLYGGSVNAKNVGGFLQRPEVDGALVGGASINAKEFSQMVKIASDI